MASSQLQSKLVIIIIGNLGFLERVFFFLENMDDELFGEI